MEHRGDIIDQAAAQEEGFRDLALRNIAKAAAPRFHPDFDGLHCMSCGGEIPEGRLKLQKLNCVGCQAATEANKRHYGG